MNTMLIVETKNGPLNGVALNGLKDIKCEQTIILKCKLKRIFCLIFIAAQCKRSIGFSTDLSGATSLWPSLSLW